MTEAIFLVFLVNFLVIYAVNPFVIRAINGKLMRGDLLEELGELSGLSHALNLIRTMHGGLA